MRSRVRQSLLGALLALASASSARGEDVLVLTNGREIRGRIVEEREDAVRIDVGGGRMTYRRDQIASVVRETAPPAAAAPGAAPGAAGAGDAATAEVPDRREEFSLLYADGVRVGTRVFRSNRLPEGWLFEEEVVQLDAKGVPVRELRTTERADPEFRPISFQFRETDGKAAHRSLVGEMRGGRLYLVRSRDGIREKSDAAAPEGARFPFAHREAFVRSSPEEGASLEAPAFEPRSAEWTPVRYEARERRPVRVDGKSHDVRVIVRKRGARTEREWIATDLAAPMSELEGEFLRALATSKGSVERLREGDTERVTGADSAARTVYADPERGFRIRKPDPSWTFELPAVRTTGAVLVVRNEPQFASVDVMIDSAAREGTTPEAAAQALQKVCRAVAPDFAVAREGFVERGGLRVWWMEATATTKGEATRTLARVVVRDGRVWRLLAACPDGAFAVLRRDFESILDSFEPL